MTLFELVAKLLLDTSGFEEKAGKAKETGEDLAGQLTNVTAKTIAMGNAMWDMADRASRAMWNFAGDLVQTAADVQAEQAQFASVFAESAGDANSIFSRLSEENNIYISRLRKEGTSMYAQFKSGGAESAEALDMMSRAMQVAADGAAFYDISLEDASYRLRSFMRGNVEAGDAIGLFTSSVAREAKAAELYGAAWQDLNEVQRETALLSIAEDAYANANATGQAAEEAQNYSNVLNNLKIRWRDVKATLGAPVLDAITPVIEELGDFLENNPELVAKFAEGIGVVAEALSSMFISAIEFVGEHSQEIIDFFNAASAFLGFSPRETGVGQLANESYTGPSLEETYALSDTNRNVNVSATAATNEIMALVDEMLAAAAVYNRTGEGERAFTDAWWALDELLSEDASTRLADWLSESGIDDYKPGETVPEEGYRLPDELYSLITGLPEQFAASTAAAVVQSISGLSIQMDGQTVGTLVAPTVMGIMSRSARQNLNTGTASA